MEGSTFKESVKIVYLENSLNRSLKLIRLGIKKLENVKSINHEDYYFVFLYLSIGFEYLMKIMISFKSYKDNKSFPTKEWLQKMMNHDLNKLREGIIENYDKISGDIIAKHREIENDKKFISENHILIILIKFITDFALKDRYFELDYAIREQRNGKTNGNKEINNTKDSVAKMNELVHSLMIKDHPSLANPQSFNELSIAWLETNKLHIIPPLKKFIGALARQFSLGILGDEAIKCRSINTIKRYAYLKDYKVEDKDLDK